MKHSRSGSSLIPYPNRDMFSYLLEASEVRPDHAALIYKCNTLDYKDLVQLCETFAAFLKVLNIRIGDIIAIVLPNSPQFVITEIGVWKAGGIVMPINPSYPVARITKILQDIKPSLLVTLWPLYQQVLSTGILANIPYSVVTTLEEPLSSHSNKRSNNCHEHDNSKSWLCEKYFWFADVMNEYKKSEPPKLSVHPDHPAIMLMGSGTTGQDKLIVGTHKSYITTALQILSWIKNSIYEWDEKVMLCVRLFHAYGNVTVPNLYVC